MFNDEPNVRQATRDRVLAAAATLDYHPNVAARSLAGRRSFLIGLAYENPSPNYVVDLQTGALDRLKGERYRLLVLPFADVAGCIGQDAGDRPRVRARRYRAGAALVATMPRPSPSLRHAGCLMRASPRRAAAATHPMS